MPVKPSDINTEYIKNKTLREEDVEALKEWLKREPHLPQISELQLILFLHSCYFKIEPAKKAIETFFAHKAHCPDFFTLRNPTFPHNKEAMECGLSVKLPQKTPEGYTVLFFTFMNGDAHNFVYADQVKLADMSTRLTLEEDGTTEGLHIVLEMSKFTFAHFAKLGLTTVKDHMTYLQDALPVRLKGFHFINSGAVMDKVMNLIKPFLRKELSDIIHIHKDVSESLYNFIPQECLPSDFGGNADSLATLHEAMKAKLLDNVDYFVQDEYQVIDEFKRYGRRKSSVTYDVEIDGCFKKLEID